MPMEDGQDLESNTIIILIIIEPSPPVHGTTFRLTAGCHGVRIGQLLTKRFPIRIMWKSLKFKSEHTFLTVNCSTCVSTRSLPHNVVCVFNYRNRGLQQLLACVSHVLGVMELPVEVYYRELLSSAWGWAEERIAGGIVIATRDDDDDDDDYDVTTRAVSHTHTTSKRFEKTQLFVDSSRNERQ